MEKKILRVESRATPVAGPGSLLLRVHACGICGTDAHIFCGDEGAAPTPAGTVLGHEFAGEVVAVGEGVTGFAPGDRVCVDPNKLCGSCEFCRRGIGHFCTDMVGIGTTVDGGFAEYCAVPASQAYKVSPSLPYAAAAMAEPVSCCLHGIELCRIRPGSVALVIGCGMIGLLMLQLARLAGAAEVLAAEPVAAKREQALALGAARVFDPTAEDLGAALAAAGYHQIDTVIECVGRTETIEQAIAVAGKNAVVMMFGLTRPDAQIQVRPFEVFKKELTLTSSYINPYTFPAAVRLIESGRIDVQSMVYQQAPLSELPAILADPARRAAGKYIITM